MVLTLEPIWKQNTGFSAGVGGACDILSEAIRRLPDVVRTPAPRDIGCHAYVLYRIGAHIPDAINASITSADRVVSGSHQLGHGEFLFVDVQQTPGPAEDAPIACGIRRCVHQLSSRGGECVAQRPVIGLERTVDLARGSWHRVVRDGRHGAFGMGRSH